ncbi:MAG: YeeE/YedE family protein [Burkholderiales bacterium]|nr:YeeE/YedE family protein [Burkholderiales bacterium]
MSEFTPAAGLVGGILIGVSAALLLGGIGRLAGISNIAHGALDSLRKHRGDEWLWRLVFLVGLMGGAWAYFTITGKVANPRQHYSPALLIVGGLLVGYGTSLGNGCTSGHGVCGLGRLAPRSLVATLVFMATGALAVFAVRHLAHL